MKHTIFIVGLVGILLLQPEVGHARSSSSSSSAPSTLYTRIKERVDEETAKGKVDDDVITFLRLVFEKKWGLTDDQIKDVLNGNAIKACNDAPADKNLINIVPCDTMRKSVQNVAIREQHVRALGRAITTLVAGYELPLSDLPERTMHLSADLLGILNIWSAGTGNILSQSKTPSIRTVTVDESVIRAPLKAIADELKKLPPEERTAAVWRLRMGVRLTLDRRGLQFPSPTLPGPPANGTERQYLDKHWTDLETKLSALWDAVRAVPITPPLSSTETAYVLFPEDMAKDLMPDNIIVWARVDGDTNNIYADAGLDWGIPLDPVFPSLKKDGADEAILGGNYPPEPVVDVRGKTEPWNGMQLCSNPLARRGYLCRPFEALSLNERCPVTGEPDEDAITLVHCTVTADKTKSNLQWCSSDKRAGGTCKPLDVNACKQAGGVACGTLEQCQKIWNCTPSPAPIAPTWCCLKKSNNMCAVTGSSAECVQRGGSPSADEEGCVKNGCDAPVAPDIRYTSAGADVCRDIGWKNNETFDPNTQCTLKVSCAASCDPRNGVEGLTKPKDASGVINVCVQQSTTGAATYIAYHELVHAYQHCALPPGTSYEKTPPSASAQQTADIKDRNTERCCRIEGEAFRLQCGIMERDGLFDTAGAVGGIPINAQTCAEYATDDACRLREGYNGCFTSYDYTQPFIDQLSVLSRKNPKQLPATCADAINPTKMDPRVKALKDLVERRDDICTPATETAYKNRIGNNICYIGQCVEQSVELHRITAGRSPAGVQDAVSPFAEPMTGTPLGNILSNPPLSQYRFPAYRPQLLAQTLDAALCQSVGLPPLMPPILCAVKATRQLELTRGIGIESVMGLTRQNNEQSINIRDLLKLSRGIGVRTGTELYSDYLRESSRSFAEIIGMAGELLEQLNDISFPTEMCPISPGLPPSLSSVPAS